MANEYYQNPQAGNEYAAPGSEYAAPIPGMPMEAAPKKSNKKLWIIIGAAVAAIAIVAVVLIFFVFGGGGPNKYTTPLDLQMDVENAKSYKDCEAAELKMTNGLFDDEMKTLLNIMKKSDDYDADEEKEEFEDMVEEYKDEYGSDYKFYYEIEDKEKLDKDDLEDAQDNLKNSAKTMSASLKMVDEDSIADMLGIKESDAKKFLSTMESVAKTMKSAKISEGYELEVTYFVKGKELDEPEELDTETVYVYKVNGRWVTLDDLDIGF